MKTISLSLIILPLSFSSAVFAQKAPSDAEIAHIVVTANSIDIEAGKIAEKKGSEKKVKEFAEIMVTDH